MEPHTRGQLIKSTKRSELGHHQMVCERFYQKCPVLGPSWRAPWTVYVLLFSQASLILATSLLVAANQDEELETRWQVPSPHRPIPADVIMLENGSNTSVSSLEEYLSQIDTQTASSTASNASLSSNETQPATQKQEGAREEEGNVHKVASLSQLEREEIHTTSFELASSLKPESTRETAEIKHDHQDKHHDGHNAGGHQKEASSHATGNSSGPKPIPQHWQVRSLLNVTHDFPLTHSRLIYGYIWPMMAAITLFTNLMIVFVLTQHDMRTPTNVVLTAIAIADIIPIVVPVPWFIYLFAMNNEKQVLYPPIACYFYQHLTRSVSEIFYFLSTWLNVLLAVQDYLAACLPHLAKKYCQLRVVVMQIITLTLLAFLLNLPQALKLVFKPVKFFYNGQLTWGCKALQARWFKDLIGEYVALYDDIFAAIIVIFVDGGPAAALITLTALLIRQLQKQRIKGHLLMEQARTASKRRRERYRQQEYEASAKVMIFVLIASLAVKIPFATTYTMMIIQSRFEIHFVENLVDFQSAITITDLAFVLSYPINFTIFCCCSKKFRHKCVQLLGECTHNTKSARNRLMSSMSMSLNSSTTSQIYKRPSIGTLASQATANNLVPLTTTEAHRMEPGDMANNDNNSNQEPLISGGSLDDRRPLVLERLCDGRHHLEWLHPGDRPPHFRALLADGSQCHECLARHEDLWAARGRRPSDDSMASNWPMPPPPPPLHIAHYRLPQIVTTRCESIREQASSDEANGDASGGEEDAGDKPDLLEPSWQKVDMWQATSDPYDAPYDESSGHPVEGREDASDGHCRDPVARESQEPSHGRPYFEEHHRKPRRDGANSSMWRHGGSDPGSSSSFMSLKHLKGIVLRRLSGQEDHNSCRADFTTDQTTGASEPHHSGHPGQRMDNKHSSLSLSNSKLTTLPNATGKLADILMSTLLMPVPGEASLSRGAFSEPSTSNRGSRGERRSRIRDPRRSHG